MIRERTFKEVVSGIVRDNVYTRDIQSLERWSYIPVFCYGTTQRGYSDHPAMDGFSRFGYGYTHGSSYLMYKTVSNEPAVFYDPKHAAKGQIYGELYVVPAETVKKIDAITCNGRHFIRGMETIIYRKEDHLAAPEYSTDAVIWLANDNDEIFLRNKNTSRCSLHGSLINQNGRFFRFTMLDDQPNRVDMMGGPYVF